MSIEVKWKAPYLKTLTQRAKETKYESSEKRHTEALISVGKFILDHGPLVKTQGAGEVYKSKKGTSGNSKFSVEL